MAKDDAAVPSALMLALEGPRALTEFFGFLAAAPWLGLAPRGEGHPVLVLPGFMASDESTFALRAYLAGLGYDVHGWELGTNIGPTKDAIEGMYDVLDELYGIYDEPVSVVGWSLGGIYARELAHRDPDAVRQVIMLGSPFRLADPRQTKIYRLYERYSHLHDKDHPTLPAFSQIAAPLRVPCTSIYSRTDGVVAWQTCLESRGPQRENIEVAGSHCGLGHNPAAMYAVADRLALPDGHWRRFTAPRFLAGAYPRAEYATENQTAVVAAA